MLQIFAMSHLATIVATIVLKVLFCVQLSILALVDYRWLHDYHVISIYGFSCDIQIILRAPPLENFETRHGLYYCGRGRSCATVDDIHDASIQIINTLQQPWWCVISSQAGPRWQDALQNS